MAFNPDDYHPRWSLITRLVRGRAGDKCEKCLVANQALIVRAKGGRYRLVTPEEEARLAELTLRPGWGVRRARKYLRITSVVIAVAHLDRDRANNRFGNLRAFCQYCHLTHDLPQHLRNRSFGRHHDGDHQLRVFGYPGRNGINT